MFSNNVGNNCYIRGILKKKNILFLYEYENISISTLYAKEAGNIILKDNYNC